MSRGQQTYHRFEKVSVSAISSGPLPFDLECPLGLRPPLEAPEVDGTLRVDVDFCSPARSRSSSFQDKMDASRDNISKRFESARGVLKKEIKTLVISRRSTLFSDVSFFRRLSASVRCSLRMTPVVPREHRKNADRR